MVDKFDDSMALREGQRRPHRWPALFLLVLLMLAGCQDTAVPPTATLVAAAASPTRPEPTVPPPTVTVAPSSTPSPSPTLLLRTPQPPAETATPPATAAATVDATATALPTATPTAELSPSPSAPSPFRQVAGLAVGEIGALWPAPDGRLWILARQGLYAVTPGQVQPLAEQQPLGVVGADDQGRIWTLFEGGASVGAYQGGSWTTYGPAQGWEPAPAAIFGRGEGAVVDRRGAVWLALGRAGLRRLDPDGSWQTLRAADVGYAPPPAGDSGLFRYDERLAFTGVALDDFGNVWTAACAVRVLDGDSPPLLLGEGQGVRWFDGDGWAGPGESAGRCVQDIEVDGSGQVWLAGRENDLWRGNVFVRYQPDPGRWLRQPVPESVERFEENPRFVRDFWFDGASRPWMEVERRGGVEDPPAAVYFQDGEEWISFLSLLPGKLVGPERALWLFLEESAGDYEPGLYRHEAGAFVPVPFPLDLLDPVSLTVDGGGRAWFTGRDGRSLWYYTGP